uniref:Uncharacterized protein n=1 Tax=Mycena chlorophos TaxID=658473 RepID=A0ABQ0KUP5_MYCCL|nr:predicted protein [Mycena chlorophos]
MCNRNGLSLLAASQNLVQLHILRFYPGSRVYSAMNSPFPQLIEFVVKECSAPDMTVILPLLTNSSLLVFHCLLLAQTTAREYDALLEAAINYLPIPLQTFKLGYKNSDELLPPAWTPRGLEILSLGRFSLLSSISIGGAAQLTQITPDVLISLLASLTLLTQLELLQESPRVHHLYTCSLLPRVAATAPQLIELRIPFVFDGIPTNYPPPLAVPQLGVLSVEYSRPPQDPQQLAIFLHHLFPRLEHLLTLWDEDDHLRAWDAIEARLDFLRLLDDNKSGVRLASLYPLLAGADVGLKQLYSMTHWSPEDCRSALADLFSPCIPLFFQMCLAKAIEGLRDQLTWRSSSTFADLQSFLAAPMPCVRLTHSLHEFNVVGLRTMEDLKAFSQWEDLGERLEELFGNHLTRFEMTTLKMGLKRL